MSLLSFLFLTGYAAALSSSPKIPTSLPLAAVNGPQKTIVILVRFSDQSNSTTSNHVANILSSMNNYYSEDSYGTTSLVTTMIPSSAAWYLLPQTMSWYGVDSAQSDNQLVNDGLQAAQNAGIDLSQYKFASIVHAGNDEAMTHVASDIHSYTIQGYPFATGPLTSIKISTSVVAESDPMGVYAHESGHLLGLPDLYDLTGSIDPVNNFVGYWEIMSLGEWNPNTGNPLIAPGTYPSLHSVWTKLQLGWLSGPQIANVTSGNAKNITLSNLEQSSTGVQVVKIPIAYNADGKMTYYLLEMRSKLGTYDPYLPFPSSYPGAGLLIYYANDSIAPGHGNLKLVNAHPGQSLSYAPFGPCTSPCVSNNTFWDRTNFVKVIISSTNSTAFSLTVDRTSAPALLLQVSTSPETPGVSVSIDGINGTSDSSGEVRLPVKYGPHVVYVQPKIPLSVGSTTITVGLTNAFSSWDDGSTTNPHGISVFKDTILTAYYRITVAPSMTTAAIALGILAVIVVGVTVHRRRKRSKPQAIAASILAPAPTVRTMSSSSPQSTVSTVQSFPRNDGLSGKTVEGGESPDGS